MKGNNAKLSLICDLLQRRTVDEQNVSWEELQAVSAEHGLLPLLAERLLAASGPQLDEATHVLFEHELKNQVAIEMLLNVATRRFMETLAAAQVPNLVLKGTALAHGYYDKPWQRPRTDVDVWIPIRFAESTAELLRQAGYTVVNQHRMVLTSRQYQASIAPVSGINVVFDVHLEISNRAVFRNALKFDECLENAQPLPMLKARSPDHVALLIHACLHRIAQGRNSAADRLIWIYDIHLLFGALSNREQQQLVSLCLERGLGGTCASGLRESRKAFGTDVDESLLAELESRLESEPASRLLQAGKWPWVWSDIRGEPTWGSRVQFVGELIQNRLQRKTQG